MSAAQEAKGIWQRFLERSATIFQILGIFAVGGFFLYRFLTGWMSANMDVLVEPQRTHLNDQEDYLAVIVKLERGEYGSLQLGDTQVKITYVDSSEKPIILQLAGTNRVAHSNDKLMGESDQRDPLNLHAKEKSVFAAALKVPRKTACLVEVTVLTHRRLDGFEWFGRSHWGQRRSSSVSLPLSDEPTH